MTDPLQPVEDNQSILGLSTSELAGIDIEDLVGNLTAIRMVVHYYKRLVDDNITLRNENNTLKTYVDAYKTQKSNSVTGAVLLFFSNIIIAFGINLLTISFSWPGLASLLSGLCIAAAGTYFSFFKEKQ